MSVEKNVEYMFSMYFFPYTIDGRFYIFRNFNSLTICLNNFV